MSWTASTQSVGGGPANVTSYGAYRRCTADATFSQIASIQAPTLFYDDLLIPDDGRTCSYQVTAIDATGESARSNIVSKAFPAPVDTTPPSAPGTLIAAALSNTSIGLNWTVATDNNTVANYRVERCQGAGCTTWAEIAQPVGITYTATGLTTATTYRFRLRAADAATPPNLGPYGNIVQATTQAAPDTTAPSVPTNLVPTVASSTQINLAWTASTDNVAVFGYEVQRCSGAGCQSWVTVSTPTPNSYQSTGLSPSTLYRFRIRARDTATVTNFSAYTAVVQATTSAAPTLPPPSAPVLNSVTFQVSTAPMIVVEQVNPVPGVGAGTPIDFGANVKADSLVVAVFRTNGTDPLPTAVSDSVNGAWTSAAHVDALVGVVPLSVWYFPKSAAGDLQVTHGVGTLSAIFIEISGVNGVTPTAAYAFSTNHNESSAGPADSGNITLSGKTVLIGGYAGAGGNDPSSYGAGWTGNVFAGGDSRIALAYDIAPATSGSRSFSANLPGTNFWGSIVVAFNVTASDGSSSLTLLGVGN